MLLGKHYFEFSFPGQWWEFLMLDGEKVKAGDPVVPGGEYYTSDSSF